MKKKYYHFAIFLLSLLFINVNNIYAAEKKCEYKYYKTKSSGDFGELAGTSKSTIYITIYDDGNHAGTSETTGSFSDFDPGGPEQLKNWGTEFNGFPDIKGTECPNYVGVTKAEEGPGEAWTRWYGFNEIEQADVINHRVIIFMRTDYKPPSDTYLRCEYDYFSIGIDYANNTIDVSTKLSATNQYFYETETLKKYWLEEKKDRECVAVYSCAGEALISGANYYIYQDKYSAYDDGKKQCELKCLKGDESCKKTDCPTMTTLLQNLDYYYYDYSHNNNINSLHEANKLIERTTSVCNVMLSNLDYNDTCMSECLNLNANVQSKKAQYNIDDDVDNGECGLSDNLIGFVLNILKWIKYLIPAIIIILSIIDFIKAISADKEEEMKKAQQKLIKRLIVAVLIFIVPLILEFVLDKMGFDSKGCGIINF